MDDDMTRFGGFKHSTVTTLAVLFVFTCATSNAQTRNPFDSLIGQWSGTGSVELNNGAREPIRCRAAYDLLAETRLALNIRCASESYNFELQSNVTYANGAISGSWSENTHNVGGSLSGKAVDGQFHIAIQGAAPATLTLAARGNRQTVTIRSRDAQATLRGANINLQRS
jgi:hypothetical protein